MSDNNNLNICNCNICFEDQTCINGFFKKIYNKLPISLKNCERSCVCKVDVCYNCVKKLENKCPLCRTKFDAWTNIPSKALNINTRKVGFNRPTKISDELADFIGQPRGTTMSRVFVIREINKYIRINDLQDANNARKINADVKLATLLNLTNTDELTYFNIQRFLAPHFITN
jgi:hypothetical protein